MERESKVYSIYKVMSPSGMMYVGYTSMTIKERWRHHKKRTFNGEALGHPFYDEIRRFNGEGFSLSSLAQCKDRIEAMQLEEDFIAKIPKNYAMNISDGGLHDAKEGSRLAWERINATPESREAYIKKLSEAMKKRDSSYFDNLVRGGMRWRKEHPKEAYKLAYRGIRCANKAKGNPPPSHRKVDARPLKERLMHKYKLNKIRSENAQKAWSEYSEEKYADIVKKIAAGQKRRYQYTPKEIIDESCANARKYINRDIQAPAASRGLKKWWAELKKDPERYEAYITARTETQRQRRAERKRTTNEDV